MLISVGLLFLVSWGVYVPRNLFVRPYAHFRGFGDHLVREIQALDVHHAIVFVSDGPYVSPNMTAPGLLMNDLDLNHADVIIARDLGPIENARLTARFPGRVVRQVVNVLPRHRVWDWLHAHDLDGIAAP
jgi:hypothetical protein